MATGGDMPGHNPDQAESEDLDHLKCQLCLEDGLLHEVVGMCVDCNDALCETCYKGHRRPRPSRNHRLIDKDQMLQDQTQVITKDTCTEKCEVHDDEIIKYYCTRHGLLGCTVCVTLGHSACKDVHYIPNVGKELDNNEEYKQAEKRLNSALETFKKVSENAKQYSEELEASCAEAVESIREFRRSADEALGNMEAEMIEKVGEIKAAHMKELAALGQKYSATQEELESALGKVKALQQAGQNCSVFTEMMRMNTKLATLDAQINEVMRDTSSQKPQIKFIPNQDTLKMMKHTATLGTLSGYGSWTCDVCFEDNKTDVDKCVACQSARPGPSVSKPGSGSVQDDLKSKFKPGAGQWECEVCLVRNGSDVSSCVACQTARPVKSFKHPAGDWTCDTCLVMNKESSVKCVACQSARPGGGQATTQKPPPLVAAKSAGSWTCDVCLVNNKTDVDKCVACQSAKPGPSVSKPGSSSLQNDLKSKYKPAAGQWECEVCLVRNGSDVSSCVACQTARPVKSFKHPTGDWTCDTCLVMNKESSVKCVTCSYARPGPPRTQTGGGFQGFQGFRFTKPETNNNSAVSALFDSRDAKPNKNGDKPNADLGFGFNFAACSVPSHVPTFGAQPSEAPSGQKRVQIKKAVRKIRR